MLNTKQYANKQSEHKYVHMDLCDMIMNHFFLTALLIEGGSEVKSINVYRQFTNCNVMVGIPKQLDHPINQSVSQSVCLSVKEKGQHVLGQS